MASAQPQPNHRDPSGDAPAGPLGEAPAGPLGDTGPRVARATHSGRVDDGYPARSARLVAALVGGVALVVYARTLMPGIAFDDWGEMQTVPHVLGVAHPTGYPTYILLAWLAQLVPIESIAFRANLLSAVCVAGALATLTLVSVRLGVRPLLAGAGALAVGAVGTVWAAATVAEVNPLHLLLIALILHRSLAWEARRSPADLALGGLLVGLALGNHLLTLFIAPVVAVFVVWVGRRRIRAHPWILVPALAAGMLALSVYLYIPLAAAQSPPLPYNHPTTFDDVFWLVSGTQFRGQFDFLSSAGPGELVAALPALGELLVARATPVLPILGLVGLIVLVRRRPAFGLLCIAILVTGAYLWATYLRLEHYLLVPWLVLAIGMSVALEWGAGALARRSVPLRRSLPFLRERLPRRIPADAGHAVGAVALAFAVGLTALNWSASDRSGDRTAQEYVDAVFEALPPDAAILSYWGASTPLWHGRWVQGSRPDLLIVDDTNLVYEGWGSAAKRIASLICERPVFVLRPFDGDLVPIEEAFRLEPFITVQVSGGGPGAPTVARPIFRVTAPEPAACGG